MTYYSVWLSHHVCHRDPGWGVEQKELLVFLSLCLAYQRDSNSCWINVKRFEANMTEFIHMLEIYFVDMFCVCMHACPHVCMHVWRSEINFKCCSSGAVYFCFWDMAPQWPGIYQAGQSDWPASSEICLPHFPSAGITSGSYHTWSLYWLNYCPSLDIFYSLHFNTFIYFCQVKI